MFFTRTLSLAALVVGTLTPLGYGAEPAVEPAAEALTFEAQVRPILKAHCFRCHGGEEESKGSLDLRLRRLLAAGGDSGPAIAPGNKGESLLYQRIVSGEMPPVDRKLTPAEVEVIGRWIDAGAATARAEPEKLDAGVEITPEERAFWSFQPMPKAVPIPSFASTDRVRTPIDAFLVDKLARGKSGVLARRLARTLLTRAYFDLVGLPPTREELAHFLADHGSASLRAGGRPTARIARTTASAGVATGWTSPAMPTPTGTPRPTPRGRLPTSFATT